jgi:hypothetical protein
VFGLAFGLRNGLHAVGGQIVDTPQKARILGEVIAATMNFTAFGITSFFLPTLISLILFLKSPKVSPPGGAA